MNLRQLPALAPLIAIFLCCIILAGCSAPRLVYPRADWLILREIDNNINLRDEQHERLEKTLAILLERHRTEQLPRTATIIVQAAIKAQAGFTETDARWMLKNGRSLYDDLVRLLLPSIAVELADLDAEQRQYFAAHLNERNDDYTQTHALGEPSEARAERALERTLGRIEHWVGELSEEQIAMVRESQSKMPDTAVDWLVYTKNKQQGLLTLLDAKPSTQAVEGYLQSWWIDRTELSADLALRRNLRIEARIRFISRFDKTFDSVQREHLVDLLQDYAQDAEALAHPQ